MYHHHVTASSHMEFLKDYTCIIYTLPYRILIPVVLEVSRKRLIHISLELQSTPFNPTL